MTRGRGASDGDGVRGMIASRLTLVIALVLGGFAPPLAALDQRETVERLAGLAPVVDTRQPRLRSFQTRGTVTLGRVRWAFECAYEAPAKSACLVADAADGVPIFVAAEDRALVYDPLTGVQEYAPTGWFLLIRQQGDNLEFQWGVLVGNGTRIEIDLRSLVAHASQERAAKTLGPNRFLLTAMSPARTARLEATIDVTLAGSYEGLRISMGEEILFELEHLAIDDAVPVSALRFPSLSGDLERATALQPTLNNMGDVVQRILRSFMLRMGLHHPSERAEIDKRFGQPFGWEEIARRDAAVTRILKRAIAERRRSPTEATGGKD